MNGLQQILLNYPQVVSLVKEFEAGVGPDSAEPVTQMARQPDWIRWFRTRRLIAFLQWDVYGAAAIAHYQRMTSANRVPLLNELGACFGTFSPADAEELEAAYFTCDEVPWRDERPDGYSYDPFVDAAGAAERDSLMRHRRMNGRFSEVLTRALRSVAAEIEAICGHYWTPGAVRLYSNFYYAPEVFHSDRWPLSVKKIMIYPSGAGLEIGTTELKLRNGERKIVDGPKGTWCVFENTTVFHRAYVPKRDGPSRPTIEIPLIPAFETDASVKSSGVHVGFPWLPPETVALKADVSPVGFSGEEVQARVLKTALLLGLSLPEKVNVPTVLTDLGFHDL